jgi:uncharacterized membrane protein
VTPSLKPWLATLFCAVGLALSVFLGLIKLYALPCIGGGGCDTVIHSMYGTVLRVPIGFVGALLWLAAIVISDHAKRSALLFLLAVGSAALMCIQFLVLRGFCLYCTAHAVTAWLAFGFHRHAPRRWAIVLGLALAVGAFSLARSKAQTRAGMSFPAEAGGALKLSAELSGVAWIAPIEPRSPGLVISLNCAACLDLLEELSRRSLGNVQGGPAIFFKVTEENRELTTTFVAAVLSQPKSKREGFLAATALLLTIKDQALSSPATAAVQLGAMLPAAAAHRAQAADLLAAQTQVLAEHKLGDTTPLLVPVTGRPRAIFKLDEILIEGSTGP